MISMIELVHNYANFQLVLVCPKKEILVEERVDLHAL